MKNLIADTFDEIAVILELLDENPFKINAYKNSARIIRELPQDIEILLKNGELEKIKGFGKATIEKIKEIILTGESKYLTELKKDIPQSLFDLFQIRGLGPKKIRTLWKELNITSVSELENACNEDKLKDITGFGIKSQKTIIEGINFIKKNAGKFLIDSAFKTIQSTRNILSGISGINNMECVGEARRGSETYASIQFLISVIDIESVLKQLKENKNIKPNINKKEFKIVWINENGLPVEIFYCKDAEFIEKLHYLTGSDKYINNFQNFLSKKNIIFKGEQFLENSKRIIFKDELEIYKHFKIDYIPPELREGGNELEMAQRNAIPKLIETRDIKGALHIHTNYTDGLFSLEEMTLKALKLGFKYIGFCDHSKTAAYVNGLVEKEIEKQSSEIDYLNQTIKGIKILKGIESDILPDGKLDYSENTLKHFDLIVASVHSNFSMSKEDMTKRIIKAVENKYTTILGHPTGRLLLSRISYQVDVDKIIDCCIKNNVAIELNSDEHRLDLPYNAIRTAIEKGLKIAINTDAHHIDSFEKIHYGVLMARKAFVTSEDVINCLPYNDFIKYLNHKKV